MGGGTASRREDRDDELVALVRTGDDDAFARLYDRHAVVLHAYCRNMLGSGHDADDALQQTFFKAFRSLTRSDREITLRPWLFTIARNECISIIRLRRGGMDRERALEPLTPPAPEPHERREEVNAALADLARLPAEQRDALLLSGFDGLSGVEVARLLDTDPARVKALVFRARRSIAASREGRETSCADIRVQLAALSGGSLRRRALREHLLACADCRQFRSELRAGGASTRRPVSTRT